MDLHEAFMSDLPLGLGPRGNSSSPPVTAIQAYLQLLPIWRM